MISYTLDNAVELNRQYPDTFHIPDEVERMNLLPGELVKLIFRIEVGGEVQAERMWVLVKERIDGGYIGELDNDPYCTTELRAGEPIRFDATNIISIYEEPPSA